MAILTKQATLNQDEFTLLHRARFTKFRVVVTGIAGEFAGVVLQTRIRGGISAGKQTEGTEVFVPFIQTFPFAEVSARAPAGVGALEINYEVRTREDA